MRTSFAFWAGAWVLLVAGCADMTGFIALQGGAPEDRVLVGSLDAVARTSQERLQKLGLTAVVTPVGEAIEVESATPKPHEQRFKLVLTREKTDQGDKTRIKLVWIDQKHDYFAALVLKMFEE